MRPPASPQRSGFTLIEAMMAVTLSTMIVGVSYAALRMAGRASTHAERISREGAILRAAQLQLFEDADAGASTGFAGSFHGGIITVSCTATAAGPADQWSMQGAVAITDATNGLTEIYPCGATGRWTRP